MCAWAISTNALGGFLGKLVVAAICCFLLGLQRMVLTGAINEPINIVV